MKKISSVSLLTLVILFVLPFIVLFLKQQSFLNINIHELIEATVFSFYQSVLASLIVLILGIVSAGGLLSLKSLSSLRAFKVILILPNLLPTLIVILSVMSMSSLFKMNVFGLPGIVITHTITNTGLIGLAIYYLLQNKMGGMSELSYIEGASRFKFWLVTLRYLQGDLLKLFFMVFIFTYTSLSVPLVFGGINATTIELLIREKIYLDSDWNNAIALSIYQIGLLSLFHYFIPKSEIKVAERLSPLNLLQVPGGYLVPLIFLIIIIYGLTFNVNLVMDRWSHDLGLVNWWDTLSTSFLISFAAGVGVFALLNLFLFHISNSMITRIFSYYFSPSHVIVAFALLTFCPDSILSPWLKLTWALTIIYFPILYRWLGSATIESLKKQSEIAQLLGASRGLVFKKILWPQALNSFLLISGIAAFWSMGEFAVSSVLLKGNSSLALLVHSLMSSYRLDMAAALTLIMLSCGAMVFLIFGGLSFVNHQKS